MVLAALLVPAATAGATNWSAPETISSSAHSPAAVVGPAGEQHLAYGLSGGGVAARIRRLGREWGEPERLTDEDLTPQAAEANPAGDVLLDLGFDAAGARRFVLRDRTGTWSGAEATPPDLQGARIALADDGTVIAFGIAGDELRLARRPRRGAFVPTSPLAPVENNASGLRWDPGDPLPPPAGMLDVASAGDVTAVAWDTGDEERGVVVAADRGEGFVLEYMFTRWQKRGPVVGTRFLDVGVAGERLIHTYVDDDGVHTIGGHGTSQGPGMLPHVVADRRGHWAALSQIPFSGYLGAEISRSESPGLQRGQYPPGAVGEEGVFAGAAAAFDAHGRLVVVYPDPVSRRITAAISMGWDSWCVPDVVSPYKPQGEIALALGTGGGLVAWQRAGTTIVDAADFIAPPACPAPTPGPASYYVPTDRPSEPPPPGLPGAPVLEPLPQPIAPRPQPDAASIASVARVDSELRRAVVQVRCGAGPCAGTLTLRARSTLIGRSAFSFATASRRQVRVPLTRSGRRTLRRGTRRVTASVRFRGGRTLRRAITLRSAR
jgi:hypothetical protein